MLLDSIGRRQALANAIRCITGSGELDKHSSEKPCWSRSLKGLGALGRLGLEGLLLFMYPNLLSSGSIYCLEGDEEKIGRASCRERVC